MQIREGGYYKQRNGLIRGPMLIDDDTTVCEVGQVSLLHPTRWDSKGVNIPRIHTKKHDGVDLVEEMAVFPMPEITDADRFVAHENDGFALEFAGNYNSYTNDDCTLYLFTQSELLRMIKDQRDHLQKSIHVTLPTNSNEDREALFQVLAKLMSAENASKIIPGENPTQIVNISPSNIMAFSVRAAHRVVESLTIHGFENDRDAALVLANHQDLIEKVIYGHVTRFLREHGVSTFHDGGVVKGPAKTGMSEHATDSFAFTVNAKSWAEGGYTATSSLKPNEVAGAVSSVRTFSHEEQRKRGWVTEMLDRADAKVSESLHLCKPAPTPVPTPGSVWSHKNGNRYAVVLISNAESERQEKYPTTVVYRNVENGKVYNRKLSDWHRSMTIVETKIEPNEGAGILSSEEISAIYKESMRGIAGSLEDFRNKAKTILGKGKPDEFIVAAAIHHGGIISLPKPARHHTILQTLDTEMQIGGVINPQQQGFITSTGRYVNRTEAWYIALAAGQITRKTSGEDTPNLYSEDLW